MPSPFPGMDPYLEEPGLWPDVHARAHLGHRASSQLDASGPRYFVRIEQRVYISDEGDSGRTVMVPDLRITHRSGGEGPAFLPEGGTALDVAEPIEAITLIEEEIRESYHRDRGPRRTLGGHRDRNPQPDQQGCRLARPGELRAKAARGDDLAAAIWSRSTCSARGCRSPCTGAFPPMSTWFTSRRSVAAPKRGSGRSGCPRSCRRSASRSSPRTEASRSISRPFSTRPMIVRATIWRSIIAPTPSPRWNPSGMPGRIACSSRKACGD